MVGICRLCERERDLAFSHIWPEWGYEGLYDGPDGPHRFLYLHGDATWLPSLPQKGLREYLLCASLPRETRPPDYVACEDRVGVLENDARRLLWEPGGVTLPAQREDVTINNADYERFKLFQLSLLWRAHLASDPFFEQVDVGTRHGEYLRAMLHAQDPGEPHEYPCVVFTTVFEGKPLRQITLSPYWWAEQARRHYVISFAGFAWYFIVSRQRRDTTCALQPDGRFVLGRWDVNESPNWMQVAAVVTMGNKDAVARKLGRSRLLA